MTGKTEKPPAPAPRRARHLTVAEFARARRCSEKTVRRRIADGSLPVIRTGRRVAIHERHLDVDL
ncbi:hypothetical protein LNKW23_48540 [Paralimibaculum aggregatum]|uniref:Helix-turn-helix domain-containing protein n=1 Tax=Paralimibaculum aggregatum TaxID=3036245 RepID=A0ABQ6LU68_9RHOB|nr:excisionase family DNA-binding protein [Limibaculum sp. NKW23]GMG85631.1 hypothetical protein LNKW23_48540 [Limibaculum sp. NKW23]